MKKHSLRKVLALVMALALLAGMMPLSAGAEVAVPKPKNVRVQFTGTAEANGREFVLTEVSWDDLGTTEGDIDIFPYLTVGQGSSAQEQLLFLKNTMTIPLNNSNITTSGGRSKILLALPLLKSGESQQISSNEVNGFKQNDSLRLNVFTTGGETNVRVVINDENITNKKTFTEEGGTTPKTKIAVPKAKSGLIYNGQEQTGVEEGVGYTLTGNKQTAAGSYKATATLASGYVWSDDSTGTKRIDWRIAKDSLTNITSTQTDFTYNGQVQKPSEASITVTATVANPTYSLSYSNANSKNAGSYTVTATGTGNFTVSKSLSYTINPVAITGITLSAEAFEFTGQVQKPTVQSITTSNGVALTTNDYTIDIPNSSAVGRYTVTVTGKNNATGTQTAQYVIETEKDLSKATVVGLKKDEKGNVDDNQTYTKEEAERIGLKYGGKTLIPGEGKDYIKTVAVKEGDSTKWEIKAEPIDGKTKGQRVIEVKKADDDVHNVTIHYVYAGTGETASPTFLQSYKKGASFAVRSPQIAGGYTASSGIIVGTMGDKDLEYTVTYAQYAAATNFTVDVVYTVEYKEGDTTTVTPKPVRLYLEDGKTYSITSPAVEGYKATIQVVQGKVNHENVIVEVRYKPAYTLCVKMIVKGHNGGADEEYGDREIPMYAGESYDFVPYLFYGDTSTDVALIGGIEAAVNENYTPDPARVTGVMPADDVTVTVTYTCKHSKTIWKNDGESGHHLECCICSSTLKTESHDLDDGVYVPLEELFEEADDVSEYEGIREDYPNGATLKSCSICSYHELTNPDEDRCPASSADENYKHLWGSWEKISDTQCQRTCYRCKTVETANHDWSNWQYASTATHYRICNHCHITETANHGGWQNIDVKTPATCIAHANVDATCGYCNQAVHGVYYGILKDMPKSNLLPTGHQFDGGWVNIHGGHTQKCRVCGAFDMEHWEAHAWSDDGETATGQCGNGTVTQHFVCRCGATKHEDTAWEHNWWHDVGREQQATCEQAGTECYTCRNCGAHDDKQVNALGHAWEEDPGNCEATCQSAGQMSYHCTRVGCSATKGGEVPAKSPSGQHEYGPDTKKNTATCTLPGDIITSHVCKYCGKEETVSEEYTGKLGHSLKESSQKIDWRERIVNQAGKRPAVVYEEVFYVTRECTRCGYNAPGHMYTVSRSVNLNKYAIVTGNVKVNLVEDGIRVNGQFGKDGGAYFNQTVNDAYKSRLELDRSVYEQHEGSVVTKFKQSYLNTLADGDYYFILTNGDELAAAKVAVDNHQLKAVNDPDNPDYPGDGIIDTTMDEARKAQIEAMTAEEWAAYQETDAAASLMTDGEYLFYLGQAEIMTKGITVPTIEKDEGGNYTAQRVIILPEIYTGSDEGVVTFDLRAGSADHQDVVVYKYDKGYTFDITNPLTLCGEAVPVKLLRDDGTALLTDDDPQEEVPKVVIQNDRVTFPAEYLESLGDGLHEFLFNYTDTEIVNTTTGEREVAHLLVDVVTTAQPSNPWYSPTGLTVNDAENGSVTAEPEDPAPGDTVTLTLTPDEGYTRASVTVTDGSGKPVELTRGAGGIYTFVMPQGGATVTGSFREKIFTDVREGDWFHDAVYAVYDRGLFVGVTETAFGPGLTMDRAMLATVLYRLAGEPKIGGEIPFTDVEEGKYYTNAVIWAAEEGVIAGYGDGRFGPKNPVTREQMVSMIWRFCDKPVLDGVDLSRFPDAGEISGWAWDAMEWAVGAGIIHGKSQGQGDPASVLDPKGLATRAEVAQVMTLLEGVAV